MFSARGSNVYNRSQQQPPQQQPSPYSPHSAYEPKLGPGYSQNSAGVADGSTSLRQSSILRNPQEGEVSGYRDHTTHLPNAPHYGGGKYSLNYGSNTQQIPVTSSKNNVLSAVEGHGVYGSQLPDSPKLTSGDYVSSSDHNYGHKRQQLYADRIADYYGERHDPLSDPIASRYTAPISYGHNPQHAEVYDRPDHVSLMRQEQLLKAQSLHSSSIDGNSRRADYLAGRGQSIHQSAQDPIVYSGRIDPDPHNFPLGSSSFGGQRTPSVLGADPQRNIEDLIYGQKPSNPGYGVSLPAGRDYGTGKGLHRTSLESDYSGTMLTRSSFPIIDDHELKEKDHHRDLLRDREKDRERERLRERERERERERARERERERERDREKARERERERERILERRDKERARASKSGLESRRDRTPPRLSRDLRSSSLGKDAAVSLRRESPHREASHRRHSPVREKRKEYACKVPSFNLTKIQKDYLSLDKRYPRLLVSPDCSKVVVHWPKGNLKVSYHTPVSFEHDFVQMKDVVELKLSSGKQFADDSGKSNQRTVWNAKMVLMSGLSQNALEDLSSDRIYGSRIPHLCNMLRFAILKNSSSLAMIGGPWDPADGGDPSSDESSLICTICRYAKELSNLDLNDCQHWNRFLEIHYDRTGRNGLFSHKEVTVIFLPDLTDCLPSLNTWRDQWLAYKKAINDREQQNSIRNEKPGEKKEAVKDEAHSDMKEAEDDKQPEIKNEASTIKAECDLNGEDEAQQAGSEKEKVIEKVDLNVSTGTGDGLKNPGEGAGSQIATSPKMGKKKIIKKVVTQKVEDKKDGTDNTTSEGVAVVEKDINEQTVHAEVTEKQDGPSTSRPTVKTLVRKKIVKKVPVRKVSKEGGTPRTVTGGKDLEPPKDVTGGSTLGLESTVKTIIKKKIIRRVVKKKVSSTDANDVVADVGIIKTIEEKFVQADKEKSQTLGRQSPGKLAQNNSDSKVENDVIPNVEPNEVESESTQTDDKMMADPIVATDTGYRSSKDHATSKDNDLAVESEKTQTEDKMIPDEKVVSAPIVATETGEASNELATSKDRDLVKEEERSNLDKKYQSQAKKSKDVNDKTREEPPKHPGLLLQTKGTKDSKLQSLSLSLDSLLDYTEQDIEESTFEISLFAESLYEMLQYEMGCRLLLFLQKLRYNFIMKRNRRKRGRNETSKRESGNKTPEKRAKNDVDGDNASIIVLVGEVDTVDKISAVKDNTSVSEDKEMEMHASAEEEDPEEDPEDVEEDPEEDPEEEMPDANPILAQDIIMEENVEMGRTDTKVENTSDDKVENTYADKVEPLAGKAESVLGNGNETQVPDKISVTMPDAEINVQSKTVESNKKSRRGEIDKELLQAFRFFDRNRTGYLRVEDMRLIIHSLGKCLPHRDVKELVISALLESNTGRDDRILYDKLIRTSDV